MAVLHVQFDIDSEVYPELHELLAAIGSGVSREEVHDCERHEREHRNERSANTHTPAVAVALDNQNEGKEYGRQRRSGLFGQHRCGVEEQRSCEPKLGSIA